MSELLSGERQVAETLDGIRADHRARYEWAANRFRDLQVVDAGCGVGYGAKVLAGAGCRVRAYDRSPEAIAFAREHFNHDSRIEYVEGDLDLVRFPKHYDAVVCFEALEHLERPEVALAHFREMAPRLVVSVPNEAVLPHEGRVRFHHRHYTASQLEALLNGAGWEVQEWWGQQDGESPPEPNLNGRTLLAVCERKDNPQGGTASRVAGIVRTVPDVVAIVAMGASSRGYLTLAAQAGDRRRIADETWVVNAMGGVLEHDLVFHMDDMRLQEARAAASPKSNVAGLASWLRKHPGPIMTSRAYPEFPGAVEFPLAEVMTKTGHGYFNSTIAYAIAYALYLRLAFGGVKKLSVWGADFSYPQMHKREKGRACVEFWLGLCSAHGVNLVLPNDTTLMDAVVPEAERLYGYDGYALKIDLGPGGFTVEKSDKPLPSVEEVERRYSHDPAQDEKPA